MKKYTEDEIKAMAENIKKGVIYVCIKDMRGERGYISIVKSGWHFDWHIGTYIGAHVAEPRGLKWILYNIFNDMDEIVPGEYSKYHMCYVPIDSKYERVDRSIKHPNYWGL